MQPVRGDYNNSESNERSHYRKVSIIILNWNGVKDTIECLESLKKITYPNYDVIVVDNGSSGNDVEVLRQKYGDRIYIIENDKNYGTSKGRNIGIRRALETGADYVQILDNDIVVAPDFLTQLIDVIKADPNIGVVGPKIYHYAEPAKLAYAGRYMNYWTGFAVDRAKGKTDCGQFEDVTDVDYASACSMLISRNALLTVGLMDERFFFWYEDIEFCTRVSKASFRVVFVPQAKMWHKGSSIPRTTSLKKVRATSGYYLIRNRFIVMAKHGNKLQLFTSTFCFILIEAPRLFIKYLHYYRPWKILK